MIRSEFLIQSLLYSKILNILKNHSDEERYISFQDVGSVLHRIELNHDERVSVMKELERAGLVRLVSLYGWIIEPEGSIFNGGFQEEGK